MEQYNPNYESIELPDILFAPQNKEDALKVPVLKESEDNSISFLDIAKRLATNSDSEITASDKRSSIIEDNR